MNPIHRPAFEPSLPNRIRDASTVYACDHRWAGTRDECVPGARAEGEVDCLP
jgi:hypothetical protein